MFYLLSKRKNIKNTFKWELSREPGSHLIISNLISFRLAWIKRFHKNALQTITDHWWYAVQITKSGSEKKINFYALKQLWLLCLQELAHKIISCPP